MLRTSRLLKSRMMGNPLVRFCEGRGGNLREVPRLLDTSVKPVDHPAFLCVLCVLSASDLNGEEFTAEAQRVAENAERTTAR